MTLNDEVYQKLLNSDFHLVDVLSAEVVSVSRIKRMVSNGYRGYSVSTTDGVNR